MGAEQSIPGSESIHKVNSAPSSPTSQTCNLLSQVSNLPIPQPLALSRQDGKNKYSQPSPARSKPDEGTTTATSDNENAKSLCADAIEKLNVAIVESDHSKAILERQRQLIKFIDSPKMKVESVERLLNEKRKELEVMGSMLNKAERLSLAVGDVQDLLERSIATANILGVSHFAEDKELCSFRAFLLHNPISTEE